MTWPLLHTSHKREFGFSRWEDQPIRPDGAPVNTWRPPEDRVDDRGDPRFSPWRTCAYCGGLHPIDFLELLRGEEFIAPRKGLSFDEFVKHPHLEFADRKYGYPHKIYIHSQKVYHPEREFKVGTDFDKKPIIQKGYKPFSKFYTIHLDEPEAPDEDFLAVSLAIENLTGISFTRDDGGLKWRNVWR